MQQSWAAFGGLTQSQEHLGKWDSKSVGKLRQGFDVRHPIPTLHHREEGNADPGSRSELFLRQGQYPAQLADPLAQLPDYYDDFLSVAFGHDPLPSDSLPCCIHCRSLLPFAASTLSPAFGLLRTAHLSGASVSIPGQNETSRFKPSPPPANIPREVIAQRSSSRDDSNG